MTMMDIIRGICAYPQRGACTESEKKASQFVYDVMAKQNFRPRFHDFTVHPDFYKVYALHFFLVAALGAIAFECPITAFFGTGLVMLSFYGDITMQWYWLRKIFRKGDSRHVIGMVGPDDAEKTIILTGHHDAGQTSPVIFEPEKLKNQIRFFKEKFDISFPQYHALFTLMAVILLTTIMRMGGASGYLVNGIYIISAAILVISGLIHLTMWGKGFAGGANDNASAVAMNIEVARKFKKKLPKDTRIIVISFGAEETMVTGSATTVAGLFRGLDKKNTWVINSDGVGGGHIRYCTGEGMIKVYQFDPELIAAAADAARILGFDKVKPYVIRAGGSDGLPFVHAGFKTITMLGLDDDDYPPNYHWHTDTPENIDEGTLKQAVEMVSKMIKTVTAK